MNEMHDWGSLLPQLVGAHGTWCQSVSKRGGTSNTQIKMSSWMRRSTRWSILAYITSPSAGKYLSLSALDHDHFLQSDYFHIPKYRRESCIRSLRINVADSYLRISHLCGGSPECSSIHAGGSTNKAILVEVSDIWQYVTEGPTKNTGVHCFSSDHRAGRICMCSAEFIIKRENQ